MLMVLHMGVLVGCKVAGIIVTIAFCVLGWQVLDNHRKASDAQRRAGELLRIYSMRFHPQYIILERK
jgi:hypothetical protein